MNKKLRTATALLLSGCLMTANVFAATPTFKDVDPNIDKTHSFIIRAAQEGLVSGMGDGTYGINAKLSTAEFVTMVSNLFYKADVQNYQKLNPTVDWKQAYLSVAYSKGMLTGTVAAQGYNVTKKWSDAVANAKISRYDMAQIMLNISETKGWQAPSSLELLTAQRKIGDWDKIPSNYQRAVATAYAKGFLSGMDAAGTFAGDVSMTRTHGAVVLCKLLDAKTTSNAPVYTNTTKLVNGSEANEKNVKTALAMLQWEYPRGSVWNMSNLYTSGVMGTGTGNQGFAYMLSDKVFGNMKATVSSASELKPGDIVYLRNSRTYVVVEDVDDDEFTYVYCDSNGKVSWGNTSDVSDLGKSDTVYTRYKSTETSTGKLADGSKATEDNAYDLLMDVKDEYSGSDKWDLDEDYKSTAFYKNYVSGDRAFAYYASDEVFGDLPVESFDGDDADEARVGDVIYLYDEEVWGIVVDNDGDTITYAAVKTSGSSKGKVEWTKTVDVDDLDDDDTIYTRYPEQSISGGSSNSSQGKNELADGSKATEDNAYDLLMDAKAEYGQGSKWNMTSTYKSSVLSNNRNVKGSQAFAYYVSDQIFGKLDYETYEGDEVSRSDIRVGDIICLYDEEDADNYVVVVSVKSSGTITYAGVSGTGRVSWNGEVKVSELDEDDTLYTRYPSGTSSKDDTLTNGKSITESNVEDLLEDLADGDDYYEGKSWSSTNKSTNMFGTCKGSKALAAKLSDAVFGKLDYSTHHRASNLMAGDVIYLDWDEEYILVTSVGTSKFYYVYLDGGKIYWDGEMKLNDLDSSDTIYTRYPD